MTLPTHIGIILGQTSAALARLYVRAQLPDDDHDYRLVGTLEGPRSVYAHTLPTRHTLKSLPASARLPAATSTPAQGNCLTEVVVPDPCFWNPDEPFLYQLDVTLLRDGQPWQHQTQPLGIRPSGCDGERLRWEGKNWVLRAAQPDSAWQQQLASAAASSNPSPADIASLLSPWRQSGTACILDNPSQDICHAASRHGLLIVARLSAQAESSPADRTARLQAELNRLAAWPCVPLAIWPPGVDFPSPAPSSIRQLLLAADAAASPSVGQAADVELFDADEAPAVPLPPVSRPRIAICRGSHESDVQLLRGRCDQLQARLADAGYFAGYWALR